MKFTEWRPIGVCDQASVHQISARVFTREDMAIITAQGITRSNWRKHPEVMEVIHRYAEDIAAFSSMTQGMMNPMVEKIQLVGIVLKYGNTPQLNRESKDGRAQFFQVAFRDRSIPSNSLKHRYFRHWKRIMIGLLLAIGILLAAILSLSFLETTPSVEMTSVPTVPACSTPHFSSTYAQHLSDARQELFTQMGTFPVSETQRLLREQCTPEPQLLERAEEKFLRCHAWSQEAYPQSSIPLWISACAENICQKHLSHLKAYCPGK